MYGVIEHVTVCVREIAAGLKCSFTTHVTIEKKIIELNEKTRNYLPKFK